MNHNVRRVSYIFLCLVPFLAIPVIAVRALRMPGVYQTIGGLLFAAMIITVWILGARAIKTGPPRRQQQALAGALLLVPFTLMSLLWVGLAAPWEATPTENRMRYFVLLVDSIAVAGGFVVLKEVLHETGERLYSTLGFAAAVLAGAAYVVWTSFALGVYVVKVRDGLTPPAVVAMGDVYDVLLFIACVLTYLTTAAFAASLGRARWLGRAATRAYLIVSSIALLFILLRGLSYPDPRALSTAWYLQPGFIAGIPAVPWIMPFLLGVVLVRRAGEESVD
jgi:hypothetical protein